MLNLYLLKLIPAQYRLVVVLITLLAVLSGSFSTGWAVNGWRMDGQIIDLQHNLTNRELDVQVLSRAIGDQNREIDELEQEGRRRRDQAEAALRLAQKENATLSRDIASLRGMKGTTCADIDDMINQALHL